MARRRLLVTVLVLLVGTAGIVSVMVATRAPAPRHVGGEAPATAEIAREACVSVALAVIDVGHNAASDRVLSRLQGAQRKSHVAASRDAHWTQLDSGVQALLTSFRRDDPQLAALGLRVVREVCQDLDVPV